VPLAGAALALAWVLTRAPRARLPVLVVIAALFAGSVARCGLWMDDATLWNRTLADHPSPRGAAWAGTEARAEGLALRNQAAGMPVGPARDAAEARARSLFEQSLASFHEALTLWYTFERSPRSKGQFARNIETNASNVCFLLGRNEEALFHAEEAELVPGPAIPELDYDRAHALLRLGFAPQAIEAMRAAREKGFGGADPEMGRFFVRAGRLCEREQLMATAEASYRIAVEASPPGPARAEAQAALDALSTKPWTLDSAAERARIAEIGARLADLSRACPAPRGPSDSE
jgi:tetratricopeptide (TPR) repeat protein